VTNQAIQVLQGPYITNTYGGGVQCQGPTLNITPYITGSASASKPYEDYYDTPVYDMRDLTGAFDDDGNPIADGAPDNPGSVLWYQPTRTGQKDNYNLSVGVSATWSRPQDKKLQALCKEAAESQIAMQRQLTANKRLDFELARLKTCANLMKEGIYFHPKSPNYVLCADVSRGTANDYSAFVVVDVSQMPYKVVAKFRDNEIKPLLFPAKIYEVARAYNQAFVLVEVNDIGEQVANALQFDMEYDNLIMASMRGRAGQILGGGFSGGKAQLGVRTTKAVKKIGCSNLKQLVEDNKLVIEDYDIINELSTFIVKGSSHQADEGCTDDLVACLFIFAWVTDQTYFKELTDMDIRKTMMREQQDMLEQDMAPFGFIVNGLEDENIGEMVDDYGTKWNPVVRDYGSNW